MSLISFINTIQEKPETFRRRIFMATITVVMAVIIALWVMNLNHALSLTRGTARAQQREVSSPSPFALLKSTLVDGWQSIKVQINGFQYEKR